MLPGLLEHDLSIETAVLVHLCQLIFCRHSGYCMAYQVVLKKNVQKSERCAVNFAVEATCNVKYRNPFCETPWLECSKH